MEQPVTFTEQEVAYIRSQRLARVATVGADGQPDVVPVGFEYDGTRFWIGGLNPTTTHRAPPKDMGAMVGCFENGKHVADTTRQAQVFGPVPPQRTLSGASREAWGTRWDERARRPVETFGGPHRATISKRSDSFPDVPTQLPSSAVGVTV